MIFSRGVRVMLVFSVIGISIFSANSYNKHKAETAITCSGVSIPFSKETSNSDTVLKGETQITTQGVNGVENVCTNKKGYLAKTVTAQPINEVTLVGTKEPEPVYVAPPPTPAPTYSERIGAICTDGAYSSATGSGACSHHHGVDHWLYN